MRPPVFPSGEQFEIRYAEQRATIVEVGGGIREYSDGGHDVLDPYRLQDICDGARGTPLIPWPNRLQDGRYSFDGIDHQVALSEPEHGNAIHGLLRWRSWRASRRKPDRVAMAIRLLPLPGYPFALDVVVDYSLGARGLAVTTTATNIGAAACPFGAGQHPYLSAGGALIDACSLQLPAASRLLTDERCLPCGYETVDGTPYDFRAARPLGDLRIDSAYNGLEREAGVATARLRRPDGTCAELWVDGAYSLMELYTGDTLAPTRRRRGLGVEPMTCPPNALHSREGVVRLEPGESFSACWGARLA